MKLSDSIFSPIRQVNRKYLHSLWRRAQEGQLDGLSEEEKELVRIMLDHSDLYFNQFEFADVLADHEFDPEREANPFLHITLHAVAENQIDNRDPVEAFQFYNAMVHNQCSRHEAIHLLMRIMIRFMFPVLTRGEAFDLEGYCRFLRMGRTMKPEKIIALLESEPDFSEEGEVGEKSRMIKELQFGVNGQDSDSLKENLFFLDLRVRERNERPLPEFLGLSPDQVHRMLYYPFLKTSDMVTLNVDLSREKIQEVPIIKEAIYFLKRLGELQPLRATAMGNLPRAFASEIHNQFPENQEFSFPIRSEEEDRKLWGLRHILMMCGWIKKHRQKFSLTRRGQVVNERGFSPADFYHLFQVYTQEFNWASRDLYPEFWIIQQSFLFSCYMLFRKAKGGIDVEELCRCFVEAFPKALELKGDGFSLEDPYKLLKRTFYIRFIERFCEYFGLVTIQNRERKFLEPNYLIKTTPLFDEMFRWKF